MAKGRGKGKGGAAPELPQCVLRVPCVFGGVSIGNGTARLGVSVPRGFLNIVAADESLVGHRLVVVVRLNKEGEDHRQQTLLDDIKWTITGTADVKRIGVNAEHISFGLTFSLKDVDIAELAKFSKGNGEFQIDDVQELPEETEGEADDLAA